MSGPTPDIAYSFPVQGPRGFQGDNGIALPDNSAIQLITSNPFQLSPQTGADLTMALVNTFSNAWGQVPNGGLSATVSAIDASMGKIYAGGSFTTTADGLVSLKKVGIYDLSSNGWMPFQSGLSSTVAALKMVGNTLFVGGGFTGVSVSNLNNIGAYQILDNSWNSLAGNGLSGSVLAMDNSGSILYVGGNFFETNSGSIILGNIGKYDISNNSWAQLPGEGLGANVNAIAVVGNDVFVGGAFTGTFDGGPNLNRIARYSITGDSWNALANNGLNASVSALAHYGTTLFVGGSIAHTADLSVTLNRIAMYDISNSVWSALPDAGLTSTVNVLRVVGTRLFVGGAFQFTASGTIGGLNFIAMYDIINQTWISMVGGLGANVNAFAYFQNTLYVGGAFITTYDLRTYSKGIFTFDLDSFVAIQDTSGNVLSYQGIEGAVSNYYSSAGQWLA